MKGYENYKPSGIEWIGEIPEHWDISKLKFIADNLDKNRIPLSSSERSVKQGEYPYYGATGIIDHIDEYIFDGEYVLIGEDGAPFFEKNRDVAFVASGKFWVNNHAHILRTREGYLPKLIAHQLNCVDYREYISGSTRDKLTQDELNGIRLINIPQEEQIAIVDYLGRKTAQIDDLVAKKQKLIDLLKEEKTAVINQAMTKGINPGAPIKGSGIPWLGEAPANWEVKRLRNLGEIRYGLGAPPRQKMGGVPLIRATNVQRGEIVEDEMVFIDPDDIPYDRNPILRENDIIVVRSGAYTGDSAIIPQKYDGSVAGYDMIVRIKKSNPLFISYALLSHYVLICQIYLHRIRAAQPHLNREELGETLILVPDHNEQEHIVNFVREKNLNIENAIAKIRREIGLLQEYRTALISEAVTGKIDVRRVN